jgi:hypothetical protein
VVESSSPDVQVTPPAAVPSAPHGASSAPAIADEATDESAVALSSQPGLMAASAAVLDEATPAPEAERLNGLDEAPASGGGRSKLPLVLGAAALVAVVIGGVSLMGSDPGTAPDAAEPAADRPAAAQSEPAATAAIPSEPVEPPVADEPAEPAETASAEPEDEPDEEPTATPVARAPRSPVPVAAAKPPKPKATAPPARPRPPKPPPKPKTTSEDDLLGRK